VESIHGFCGYRGTSLVRYSNLVGPYRRPVPRALCWFWGGEGFLMSEGPLYGGPRKPCPAAGGGGVLSGGSLPGQAGSRTFVDCLARSFSCSLSHSIHSPIYLQSECSSAAWPDAASGNDRYAGRSSASTSVRSRKWCICADGRRSLVEEGPLARAKSSKLPLRVTMRCWC